MGRAFASLLAGICILVVGCGTGETEPKKVSTVAAPDWVADLLDTRLGEEGTASARARLFQTREDGEVFAGLVAFSRAGDPELRRLAAFHLSSMAPVAEHCGVPAEAALETLAGDEDPVVRGHASRYANLTHDGTEATAIHSGEALVGSECAIPNPSLEGTFIHLLIREIEWGQEPWNASLDIRAEARIPDGLLLGSFGGRHTPDLTRCSYLGVATEEAQYGVDLWLRVLDRTRVRWWLRGLSKPLTD